MVNSNKSYSIFIVCILISSCYRSNKSNKKSQKSEKIDTLLLLTQNSDFIPYHYSDYLENIISKEKVLYETNSETTFFSIDNELSNYIQLSNYPELSISNDQIHKNSEVNISYHKNIDIVLINLEDCLKNFNKYTFTKENYYTKQSDIINNKSEYSKTPVKEVEFKIYSVLKSGEIISNKNKHNITDIESLIDYNISVSKYSEPLCDKIDYEYFISSILKNNIKSYDNSNIDTTIKIFKEELYKNLYNSLFFVEFDLIQSNDYVVIELPNIDRFNLKFMSYLNNTNEIPYDYEYHLEIVKKIINANISNTDSIYDNNEKEYIIYNDNLNNSNNKSLFKSDSFDLFIKKDLIAFENNISTIRKENSILKALINFKKLYKKALEVNLKTIFTNTKIIYIKLLIKSLALEYLFNSNKEILSSEEKDPKVILAIKELESILEEINAKLKNYEYCVTIYTYLFNLILISVIVIILYFGYNEISKNIREKYK